jgi:hypothetical protein
LLQILTEENEGGRRVDVLLAFLVGDSSSLQNGVRLLAAKSFVDLRDRQAKLLLQAFAEFASGPRCRALLAVHLHRDPEDQLAHLLFPAQSGEGSDGLLIGLYLQRGERSRRQT